MKHLKIKIMSIALLAAATSSMAQSLDKMNWLNEPQQWEIKEGKALVMDVPAKTDLKELPTIKSSEGVICRILNSRRYSFSVLSDITSIWSK
jgi:hypothetical protein